MTTGSSDWQDIHKNRYKNADWIDKPSLFAVHAIKYFPSSGTILELGAGQGQDSRFFAEHGYTVVSTDNQQAALDLSKQKTPNELTDNLSCKILDLSKPFDIPDTSFDIVYAHLSLHYFTDETTKQIFSEIHRVLKSGGIIAFFTNATTDPEYGTGTQLESDYFDIEGMTKRFFNTASANTYTAAFSVKLLDANGETYKDSAKGVHNLIRYIGTKA